MGLQAFIDSDTGVLLATALHTAGAILLLGGVVTYIGWHHQIRRGAHNANLLAGAAVVGYVAIATNLLGGFMRTFETGHPPIEEIGSNQWVQILAVKHVFLFAGMAAMIVLVEVVARRAIAAHRAGEPVIATSLHRAGVVVSIASILVASVLGAAVAITPLGDDGEIPESPDAPQIRYVNATGQLTSLPLAPSVASGAFDVVAALSIEATLTWTPTQFPLTVRLVGPGTSEEASGNAGSASLGLENPVDGPWRYEITSDSAVGVTWSLSLKITPRAADLTGTETVPAGDFFEINLEMPTGAPLHWDWSSDAVIAFDVHSHFGGSVQTYEDRSADGHHGMLTTERAGGYSLMWENTGKTPVTVTYHVWGVFTVDSYHPVR